MDASSIEHRRSGIAPNISASPSIRNERGMSNSLRLDYDNRHGRHVPTDLAEAIDRYVFDGLEPGGFVTSLFAHDLQGAVQRAHPLIHEHFVMIAQWVLWYAPADSQGSYEAVEHWIRDQDGRRSRFQEQYQRERMWRRLHQV